MEERGSQRRGEKARGECEAWEGAWRHRRGPGRREEAGGGQGKQEVAEASRARTTPRLCLLAEEDDRGGVEMGWAAQELGRLATG